MARQVGIIVNTAFRMYARGVAAGIREQAQSYGDWRFQFFGLDRDAINTMANSELSGAIAIGLLDRHAPILKTLRQLSIPGIHAGELYELDDFPQVTMLNTAVGALGAGHLLERGLQRFAFVGEPLFFSNKRREGFVQALLQAGHDHVPAFCFSNNDTALTRFLKRLRTPAGIMASSDGVAWSVSQCAWRLGIRIPEQLALLGVDNEDPWCTMASPPISSIDFPGQEIGRKAAALLEAMMRGQSIPLHTHVESKRIVQRQSTDVVITDKADIAAAIRYIRQRQGVIRSVGEVVDAVGVSRSTLERGFKLVLGITPLQEIHRLRIESAKELLANTQVPMKVIARRCGFADGREFSTAIRKALGVSPSQYRAAFRDDLRKAPPDDPLSSQRPHHK